MRVTLSPLERLLWISVAVLMGLAVALPPLQQPATYNHFADARPLLGLPRAGDTLSNLPFLVFGLWGLARLRHRIDLPAAHRSVAVLFFVGLLATALGSGWYHLAPDNARLVGDRAGMTAGFAGILGLAVAQHISDRAAVAIAVLMLVMGWLAVAVWSHTGNLTPWAVVQGGGVLLVLALMRLPNRSCSLPVAWSAVVAAYALAKVAETFDSQVYACNGLLSGHSLKHLLASLAALPVIHALGYRNTAP